MCSVVACADLASPQDRDGSGTIEWKEFIGLMAAFGHDNTDARFDALFSVMDRDHNQAVDANELRNGVLRLMGMQPCQEVCLACRLIG